MLVLRLTVGVCRGRRARTGARAVDGSQPIDTVYAVSDFSGWVEVPSPLPQPLLLARWHAGNRGALACQHAVLSLIGHVAENSPFEGLPDKSETA